jgi:hemerythrin-like domain-containing protein
MLTATYSIIALKIEQNRVCWTFSSIHQYILTSIRNIKNSNSLDLEAMLNRLTQFERSCHQRKMEVFVIPALRKITHEADALLAELDSLSEASGALLRSLREKLQQVLNSGSLVVDEICASLEQCCAHFYRKLMREEELVQIAERLIPTEEWFGIAAGFLVEDGRALALKEPVHDEEE